MSKIFQISVGDFGKVVGFFEKFTPKITFGDQNLQENVFSKLCVDTKFHGWSIKKFSF